MRWLGDGVECAEEGCESFGGRPNGRALGDRGGLPGFGKVGLAASAAAVAAAASLIVPV